MGPLVFWPWLFFISILTFGIIELCCEGKPEGGGRKETRPRMSALRKHKVEELLIGTSLYQSVWTIHRLPGLPAEGWLGPGESCLDSFSSGSPLRSHHLPQGHLPLLLEASHPEYLLSRQRNSCWSLWLVNCLRVQLRGGFLLGKCLARFIWSFLFCLGICWPCWKYQEMMCVCVCSVTSVVSDSLRPPWTVAHQAPQSMGFPRQEYWSGLPCPPPGDYLNTGIKPFSLASPAFRQILNLWAPGLRRWYVP